MKVLDRFKDFMGLNEDEYSDYDETDSDAYRSEYQPPEPPTPQPVVEEERRGFRRATETRGASKINNVVGMPGIVHGVSEMILIEPRSFEEMPQVIDALRHRKSVILNMTLIRQEEAQRSVDFVAGGTYAIDGHYERIGDNIFLFTPNCVQVSTPTNVIHDPANQQTPIEKTVRSNRTSTPLSTWGNEPIQAVQ
ncbi:cell division protein SepF [Chamaesiphon polymorphus]|uniref:Cell division protein SepF n=1 Tax=Chamaesiphon polymorphus CCALA 037 TaxID=2107692 RepID=A0A2T1FD97_9CYAN|nr:cell division protein SepF [Chamaesiphon polymorphus]PSB42889.1 cell division protein SepF [Chamaesiphon polymorphus CCALA 037]